MYPNRTPRRVGRGSSSSRNAGENLGQKNAPVLLCVCLFVPEIRELIFTGHTHSIWLESLPLHSPSVVLRSQVSHRPHAKIPSRRSLAAGKIGQSGSRVPDPPKMTPKQAKWREMEPFCLFFFLFLFLLLFVCLLAVVVICVKSVACAFFRSTPNGRPIFETGWLLKPVSQQQMFGTDEKRC